MEPNKDITKYIEELPIEIKKIISENIWEKRVVEISQKYSLDETQTQDLINITLLVIVGLSEVVDLKESITTDISVSEIVSEQIVEDLDKRVFEYLYKEIDNSKNTSKNIIPEIRPDNLPSKDVNQNIASVPVYTPRPKVVVEKEPVQTPLTVPRFKAVPIDEGEVGSDFIPKLAPKPNANGIMEAKLNSITSSGSPSTASEPKKYSVDPYREPIS